MLYRSLVMEAPDTVGGCSKQRRRIEKRSLHNGGNNDLVAFFSLYYYLARVFTQMRHFLPYILKVKVWDFGGGFVCGKMRNMDLILETSLSSFSQDVM